jgi:hypothetical protein
LALAFPRQESSRTIQGVRCRRCHH